MSMSAQARTARWRILAALVCLAGCDDARPCEDTPSCTTAPAADMAHEQDLPQLADMSAPDLPQLADMSAPDPCDADALRCDSACAQCPTEGVLSTGCAGERCVALTCDTAAGYASCDAGCCLSAPPPANATLPEVAHAEDVALALTSRGAPVVMARSPRALSLILWDGQRWAQAPGPEVLPSSRAPRLALDREDTPHLFTVEQDPAGGLVHHQQQADGSWTRAQLLDTATTPDAELIERVVVTRGAETLEVAALLRRFASETAPGLLSVWLMRRRAGRWEAPQQLSLGERSCTGLSATVDGSATTHILVECQEATHASLHHVVAPSQGVMALAPSAPQPSGGGGVSLGVTPGGALGALFQSVTGALSTSTGDAAGWSAPEQVDDLSTGSVTPTLALTRDGAWIALHRTTGDARAAWHMLRRDTADQAWRAIGQWDASTCAMRADREGHAHLVQLHKGLLTYFRHDAP